MSQDVILLKKESLDRTLQRLEDYLRLPSDLDFDVDTFKQDALAANLLRLAQQSVDLANYVIRIRGLGIPKSSGDSFDILQRAGLLTTQHSEVLIRLVGLRNVYLHEYAGFESRFLKLALDQAPESVRFFCTAIIERRGYQ